MISTDIYLNVEHWPNTQGMSHAGACRCVYWLFERCPSLTQVGVDLWGGGRGRGGGWG